MLELTTVTLAAIAAVVLFRAIWPHAAAPGPEEEEDEDGFDASAARWGYLHDKRGL